MSRKRVTSFDVARRAGVSRSVVSAVLNNTPGIGVSEETREAVLEAIRELDYHVDAQARSMKTGKSMCLAAYGNLKHPLFLQLLEGMQKSCEARGYQILLCSGSRGGGQDRSKLLTLYHQRRIDGIVTFDDTSYCDTAWAEEVIQAGVPYISVEGFAEYDGVSSIQADYRGSIALALDHLAGGTGSAAAGPSAAVPLYLEMASQASSGNWAERNRREAYAEWCARRSCTPRLLQLEESRPDELEKLLAGHLADGSLSGGLLINWSSSVPDLYRAAWKLRLRIGEDLRVMAADNTIRGHKLLVPALSCVEIPYGRMGAEAVEAVLRQMDGGRDKQPEKIWLQASLHRGESV
ncbi:LacI family DNA-binding transcriptional regulator [Paenibacillus sp. YN15]|uniref:LacI family DNA-binding transcriptional regulator n=1 Tax=Paenibacillus sp. YN15 TaxID=1742774 RepID=UPI000DCDD3B6|nr:LacI family DNA-binding transcriptional regulator [Paenibacillus sp. YN15]RAV06468.1 LacI family transcriptional regulator [Paenibacillus sp. YN15]